jgi:hypothetical protein
VRDTVQGLVDVLVAATVVGKFSQDSKGHRPDNI